MLALLKRMANSRSRGFGRDLYARPRVVSDPCDCFFYHVMDLPGYGTVSTPPLGWDLRGKEHEYLGRTVFQGKRVLELGTASGFLSFYMEKQGAEVIGFDLSDTESIDLIPSALHDWKGTAAWFKENIGKVKNSYWLAHRALKSKARIVYGSVYNVPEQLRSFDISVFGAILLHLRDPFLALQRILPRTKETVVIAETRGESNGPCMEFAPGFDANDLVHWWALSPEVLVKFLKVLGFGKTTVTYHSQHAMVGKAIPWYTVVGHRTSPMPNV